jgi:hypothetical protein
MLIPMLNKRNALRFAFMHLNNPVKHDLNKSMTKDPGTLN